MNTLEFNSVFSLLSLYVLVMQFEYETLKILYFTILATGLNLTRFCILLTKLCFSVDFVMEFYVDIATFATPLVQSSCTRSDMEAESRRVENFVEHKLSSNEDPSLVDQSCEERIQLDSSLAMYGPKVEGINL